MNFKTRLWARAILIFLALFIGMCAFSQDSSATKYPKLIIFNSDTVYAFTVEQAQNASLYKDSLKTYKSLYENCEYKKDTLLGQLYISEEIHQKDSTILARKDDVLSVTNEELTIYKRENKTLIRKNKIKTVGIGAASGLGLLGYVLLILK